MAEHRSHDDHVHDERHDGGHGETAHGGHGDDGHGDGGHEEGGHGHGGFGKYIAVTIALIVLTGISFTAGSSPAVMGTPQVGWTIMLAVSCCKALLVMLFFMHLLWEANWKYVLTIPASIMSIFLLLMLVPDILGRSRHYSEERWLRAPRPASAAGHATPASGKSHNPPAAPAH